MNNFVKLGEVDTLVALGSIKDEMWHSDTYLRDYPQGPFGETDSIILRFPPRTVHETEAELAKAVVTIDEHENVWLPVSEQLPEIKRLVFDLARMVESTRIGRVIINRILPGGQIFRHADTPSHANYWSRYHIVLHALPGVKFYCGEDGQEEMVEMVTNEVWFFRNELPHEVINESADPRLHLVIDLKCAYIK